MFADYHVHTEFSDDSVYPMGTVIQDAIAMGMNEICLTDHVDYGVKIDWDCGKQIQYRNGEPLANVDYPRYMFEIDRMKRLYGNKIRIKNPVDQIILIFEMIIKALPIHPAAFTNIYDADLGKRLFFHQFFHGSRQSAFCYIGIRHFITSNPHCDVSGVQHYHTTFQAVCERKFIAVSSPRIPICSPA